MTLKENIKQTFQQLSPQEQQEYIKLNKIFSQPVTEVNGDSIKKGVQYLAKNWRNYSLAMLTALMLNPNISQAMSNYSPETYDAIKTELSTSNKGGETKVEDDKITVDFSQTFESGKSTVNREELQQKIQEIQSFLKGKKAKDFGVKVIAGESQVTNPFGYGKGELAAERANNVKVILDKFGFGNVQAETTIGQTPYQKGKDNPRDGKYEAEQFVRVEIFINTESICNLNQKIDKTEGTGLEKNNYITMDEPLSGTGDINFSTGTIPDRLVILGKNGSITKDLGYITTKNSPYPDWKYVPVYVAQLTKLYKSNSQAVSGGKIKVIKASTFEDLVKQLLNNPSNPNYRKSGEEIGPGLLQLKQMIDKGVTEFVIYDVSSSDIKIPFDGDKEDSRIRVYSPLGKTGFHVKGSCQR